MKTFLGICLQEQELTDGKKTMLLERGKEYTISVPDARNEVTVFSNYLASGVPASIFGGLVPGPGEKHTESPNSEDIEPTQQNTTIVCSKG